MCKSHRSDLNLYQSERSHISQIRHLPQQPQDFLLSVVNISLQSGLPFHFCLINVRSSFATMVTVTLALVAISCTPLFAASLMMGVMRPRSVATAMEISIEPSACGPSPDQVTLTSGISCL